MSTVIPNNYGQVTQQFSVSGRNDTFVIVTGHAFTGTTGALYLGANYRSGFAAAFGHPASTSDAWTLGPTIAYYRDAFGVLTSFENLTFTTGVVPGIQTQSPQVSCLVQKRTGLAGRKFRGRMYLPPFQLTDNDVSNAGIIDSGIVAAIQTQVDDFLTELVTRDIPLVLLHSDATTPTAVSSLIVQATVATQRRRIR